jgi:hypothetical protein
MLKSRLIDLHRHQECGFSAAGKALGKLSTTQERSVPIARSMRILLSYATAYRFGKRPEITQTSVVTPNKRQRTSTPTGYQFLAHP